jgi:tRNA/tmRNA/rRNA uracil-C5-methylase (TrmA/RlmC/RlmD family)
LYVSCDPATQARDVKAILERGFRLETLAPLDMFPQTADVEVVASLLPVA